jgi:hypothetical protein
MGLIVDDHDRGVHGELRRESFVLFSDFGKEWSVELDLAKLDEVLFVLNAIKNARDQRP